MAEILYIEDSEYDHALFKAMFKNHEISIATNYNESLDFIEDARLVVIDINLGNENGYKVLKDLRKQYPDKAYILTSGTLPNVRISLEPPVVGKDHLTNTVEKKLNELNG